MRWRAAAVATERTNQEGHISTSSRKAADRGDAVPGTGGFHAVGARGEAIGRR